MTASADRVLEGAGWTSASVRAFVGHQANQRILDSAGDRLGIAVHYRYGNIAEVGNSAAASIPSAMADTAAISRVRPGARSLLTVFGGGLTWGSTALTWPDVLPVRLASDVLASTHAPRPHDRRRSSHGDGLRAVCNPSDRDVRSES
ncbi:3-oxoacyl-[acyl-carrier-protein] synthase III C-terminal domain-containing protein [Streptomyces shenzhenensis]|uniref:3-oxoacyl-[acyl-carrier-protein] synthase III C-terminal domain-containing protein n=1 Tax=Streptomyces shenzhenensis TaxID=943815 RepID=UPI0033D0724E